MTAELGGDLAAIPAVLARLRATFASGRTRTISWRRAQLDALGGMLRTQRRAVEEAVRADLGRDPIQTYLAEVYALEREIVFAHRNVARWSRPKRANVPVVLQPARAVLVPEPLGSVAIVGTWNYPINLVLGPLVAALAAGNCAVVKPSEFAPASAALLAEVLPRYLDPDVVAVATGGPEVADAIIDSGVDHVFFTGSSDAGRLVMARAAARLTPVTLELGGKSPVYVHADVDVTIAARRIVWGKLLNAGQSCIAPDFVLVERSRHADLLSALAAEVSRRFGPDPRANPHLARIVDQRHVERLARLLADHGGRVVCGGEIDHAQRYVAPTIIDQPRPDSALMSEEIFGPLLPVLPVEGFDDAAALLAGRSVPLALYVFSNDGPATEAFLAQARSGAVCVNTTMQHFAASTLPFGGLGESGFGRYHGRFGFDQLSHFRPVLRRPLRPDPGFVYPPYGTLKERLLRGGLALTVRRRG